MRTLPTTMIRLLAPFAPLFSERLFQHVQVLLAGTILAPGKRTVASALREQRASRRNGASAATIECSTVPSGRARRPVASCWGCSWRHSCPEEDRWWLV